MTMKAKFPGKCSKLCGVPIAVGDDIDWAKGVGAKHVTCPVVPAAAVAAPGPKVDASRVHAFLGRATAKGLKAPAVRFLDIDGVTELRMSLAPLTGKNPGAIYAKSADTYLGLIAPDGTMRGAGLVARTAHIAAIMDSPADAAKKYAALTARCSFCNLPLTDDGSVAVGYGPICASNYDLPWTKGGVAKLDAVPASHDHA
jgi:hypothetical protein